ncbi:glycosyltransferase family 4 protein [Jeongeupia naejangsanensis]|uniref:Glycosyltransferase family 4 protein n=1 Tax=Jeongeupia naejangsanensis TaxID=613195 RepID=A0ABS2BP26_9NEIS|nr:glycosyltransferase family 4 protein [Jeongeupia naejangsanensis]MBM3117391.1 glycosyltransferase family 4 protein [Jeongeupia naejangsanensis]
MTELRQIIVSSVSNCIEKNGIVSFMAILRCNDQAFHERGVRLGFANYVDFPVSAVAPVELATTSTVRRWMQAAKRSIKGSLIKSPLGAFLLMVGVLSPRALIAVIKARRLEEPGCLHFHQDVFCAFYGLRLLRRDTPKVLLLHSSDDPLNHLFVLFHGMRGTRYEKSIRAHFRRVLETMDCIVTLNERYAQTLRSEFPSHDIRCIYNTSSFASAACGMYDSGRSLADDGLRRLEIVAVGSLQYIKGFDLLVQAVAALSEVDRQRLHITIVGGGTEREPLQAAIDAQSLQNEITLNGESNDVASFLARADAYILTSRDEGFPIALIEASSFGLPIVSTRVGSIPEVFDKGSCLFMDAKIDSIRDALTALGRGTVDLRELALRSQEVFDRKLSLDSFLDAYADIFNCVERRHAR